MRVCVMFHYRVSKMGVAHELFLPIVLHAAKQSQGKWGPGAVAYLPRALVHWKP